MKAETRERRSFKAWGRYALVLLLTLLGIVAVSTRAFSDESKLNWMQSITYVDENGNEQTKDFFVVGSVQEWFSYLDAASEPYENVALKGDWNFPNLEFFSETEALVVMDGCNVGTTQLVIHGAKSAGDRQFKIYGQKEGSGLLKVYKNGGGGDFVAFDAFNDSFYDEQGGAPTPRLSMYGGTVSIMCDSGKALKVERNADSAGELEIAGGTLTVKSDGTYGAEVGTSLLVTGGTFEATGAQAGIIAHGGCDISGGTTMATATKDAGVGLLVEHDSVITDGVVNATGPGGGIVYNNMSTDSGDLVIEGGTVTGTCTGVGIQGASDGPGIGVDRTSALGYDLGIRGGTVTGTSVNGAGIGGAENASATIGVHIEGGTVTGTSTSGAGIGTGRNTTSDKCGVIIVGGTVTAASRSGAGIGGGDSSASSSVTIKDGTVEKAESMTGAGIGGGFGENGGVVYIEGGTVNAYASEDASGFLSAGAGIGGGNVTISGGEVYARSARGGAGIGGGYGGAGGSLTVSGGTVVAWSQQDGDGQAIGHGLDGGGSDNLGINYDAAVTAGDDEEHAQYATVSATNDGRTDACRQRWARIGSCDHKDAGTYTVPSSDGSVVEIHCAHCGAYLGKQNRQETVPANSSTPTATTSTGSSKSTTALSLADGRFNVRYSWLRRRRACCRGMWLCASYGMTCCHVLRMGLAHVVRAARQPGSLLRICGLVQLRVTPLVAHLPPIHTIKPPARWPAECLGSLSQSPSPHLLVEA